MTASPCFEVKASHVKKLEKEVDDFPQSTGKKRTHDMDFEEVTSLAGRVFDNHTETLSVKKILSELNEDNLEQSAQFSQYFEKFNNLDEQEKKLRERWAELNIDAALWDVMVEEEDRSFAIGLVLSLYQDGFNKKVSSAQPRKLQKKEENSEKFKPSAAASSKGFHKDQDPDFAEAAEQSRLEALKKLRQNGITLLPEDELNLDLISAYLGSVGEEDKRIREEQDRDYQKSLHIDQLKILRKKLGTLTNDLEMLHERMMKLREPIDKKKSAIDTLETEIENHQSRMQRFGPNPKLEQDVKVNQEKIKALKEEISQIEQENSDVFSEVHLATEERKKHTKETQKAIEELESLISYENSETKSGQ
ncbi:MAG: hypothetical protein ACTHJ4_05285 [Candidatus Nucleicultricaceae bacterium]